MTVRVAFMGDLLAVIGQRNLQVDLPSGSTVADLLASLSKTYGDAFTNRLFSAPGTLQHTVLIFVDDVNVKEHGGLAAKLGGAVEVVMLPMYGGG